MGKRFLPEDAFDDDEKTPVHVTDLPYYDTLRTVLEPYTAAKGEADADKQFTSTEIIQALEEHHGVPQGPQQGKAEAWVQPEDFVRAMQYLGYTATNAGGMRLVWLLKRKA